MMKTWLLVFLACADSCVAQILERSHADQQKVHIRLADTSPSKQESVTYDNSK